MYITQKWYIYIFNNSVGIVNFYPPPPLKKSRCYYYCIIYPDFKIEATLLCSLSHYSLEIVCILYVWGRQSGKPPPQNLTIVLWKWPQIKKKNVVIYILFETKSRKDVSWRFILVVKVPILFFTGVWNTHLQTLSLSLMNVYSFVYSFIYICIYAYA